MSERIIKLVKSVLSNEVSPEILRVRELKDGSISFDLYDTQAAIRYCRQKTQDYILFSKSQVEAINPAALDRLTLVKKAADNPNPFGNRYRLCNLSLYQDDQLILIFSAIATWCFTHASIEFDICSRYESCSDSMCCVNPDMALAIHCGYRTKLAKGIVFYGKNRNVD